MSRGSESGFGPCYLIQEDSTANERECPRMKKKYKTVCAQMVGMGGFGFTLMKLNWYSLIWRGYHTHLVAPGNVDAEVVMP